MGSASSIRVLLLQLWALQRAASLSVEQRPKSLLVSQGSDVTLACRVTSVQAWERLRVEWSKDKDVLCQLLVTNSSLNPGIRGPWGQLSWQASGDLILRLDHVGFNDSGEYVCRVTVEIPELDRAEGSGTRLLVDADGPHVNTSSTPGFPGLLLALLVAGGAAVTAVALGAGIWSSCRRRSAQDSGSPFYCNVLYRSRGIQRRNEAWSGGGKVLDSPEEAPLGSPGQEEESRPVETQSDLASNYRGKYPFPAGETPSSPQPPEAQEEALGPRTSNKGFRREQSSSLWRFGRPKDIRVAIWGSQCPQGWLERPGPGPRGNPTFL